MIIKTTLAKLCKRRFEFYFFAVHCPTEVRHIDKKQSANRTLSCYAD